MQSVDQMIDAILRREGGFVDHPADRGGPTHYGITQKTLSRVLGRAASRSEVERLDPEMARDIYRREYYLGPGIDGLPAPIQPFVFDCAVNHGPRRAIRFVQNVCNDAGFGPLDVDGVMGPRTRTTAGQAQQAMGETLLEALIEERLNFYDQIVANDPGQEVFLRGWRNRVAEFQQEVA